MKSERAKELIEKYAVGNSRNAAPSLLKKTAILCVESAEQETEERMRRKAVEAFEDIWFSGMEPDNEELRKRFIKKLNEA